MNKIIYVASGKGGVGKTTLSANIAGCLEKIGKHVLLMDGDLSFRNLDLILGMQDESLFDIQDLYRGVCDEGRGAVQAPGHKDLFFIPAPMRLEEDPGALYRFMRRFAVNKSYVYDYVIIDCPAGADAWIRDLACPEASLLCVATPDRTSVRDAERLAMDMFALGVADARLVINRINAGHVKKGWAPDMDDIIDGVGLRLIGLIPEDARVSAYANRGRLICDEPRIKTGRAYRNIACRITGVSAPLYKFW